MECLNPFGSSKDRAVKQFLMHGQQAQREQVVEASSGSTAISLVQAGHILGKEVTLFLPNDLAEDKVALLLISTACWRSSRPAS
jgi:cysteine synthase